MENAKSRRDISPATWSSVSQLPEPVGIQLEPITVVAVKIEKRAYDQQVHRHPSAPPIRVAAETAGFCFSRIIAHKIGSIADLKSEKMVTMETRQGTNSKWAEDSFHRAFGAAPPQTLFIQDREERAAVMTGFVGSAICSTSRGKRARKAAPRSTELATLASSAGSNTVAAQSGSRPTMDAPSAAARSHPAGAAHRRRSRLLHPKGHLAGRPCGRAPSRSTWSVRKT